MQKKWVFYAFLGFLPPFRAAEVLFVITSFNSSLCALQSVQLPLLIVTLLTNQIVGNAIDFKMNTINEVMGQ